MEESEVMNACWCWQCNAYRECLGEETGGAQEEVVCAECGTSFVERCRRIGGRHEGMGNVMDVGVRESTRGNVSVRGAQNETMQANNTSESENGNGIREETIINAGGARRRQQQPIITTREVSVASLRDNIRDVVQPGSTVSVHMFTAQMGANGVPVPGTESTLFNSGPDMTIGSLEEFVRQLSFLESSSRTVTHGASAAVVESLPKKTITEACQKGDCCICMSDFEVGDEVVSMPCGHSYHDACLKEWLKTHNSCPVCRDKVPTDEDVEGNVDPSERSVYASDAE